MEKLKLLKILKLIKNNGTLILFEIIKIQETKKKKKQDDKDLVDK